MENLEFGTWLPIPRKEILTQLISYRLLTSVLKPGIGPHGTRFGLQDRLKDRTLSSASMPIERCIFGVEIRNGKRAEVGICKIRAFM